MKVNFSITRLSFFTGLLLSMLAQQTQAAGFAIIEHSASGMGNAFAGAAAVGEDASTTWFNPAALTRLKKRQAITALHIIDSNVDYTDKGSSLNPLFTDGTTARGTLTGTNGTDEELGFVPNAYIAYPIKPGMVFGLGINAPFGLVVDYDDDWVGRYHALRSDLATININPAFAMKFGDKFSVGFGVSAQYADVTLSNAIDSGAVCFSVAAGNPALQALCVEPGPGKEPLTPNKQSIDSKGTVSGDSWGYGFNLGLLYEFNEGTRLGLSYRSEVEQEVEGDADFNVNQGLQDFLNALAPNPASALFSNTGANAVIDLPASASISFVHDIENKVELLFDATWTQWSSFEELRIKFDNPVQPDSVQDESWEDVWRFSAGLNIRMSDKWKLRTGLAWDEEPIPDTSHRTPRIPGNDRTWVTLGAGINLSPHFHIDLGYAHLFLNDTPIDDTSESTGYTLRGEYKAAVDIYSAQLNWYF